MFSVVSFRCTCAKNI